MHELLKCCGYGDHAYNCAIIIVMVIINIVTTAWYTVHIYWMQTLVTVLSVSIFPIVFVL